jgi:hypothetical protein
LQLCLEFTPAFPADVVFPVVDLFMEAFLDLTTEVTLIDDYLPFLPSRSLTPRRAKHESWESVFINKDMPRWRCEPRNPLKIGRYIVVTKLACKSEGLTGEQEGLLEVEKWT